MLCILYHDGQKVTAIEADVRGYTLNHGPAAAFPLAELVGLDIATSTADFFARGRARRNCTHMLDLAWTDLPHAGRGPAEWFYEIEIPDTLGPRFEGVRRRDGDHSDFDRGERRHHSAAALRRTAEAG